MSHTMTDMTPTLPPLGPLPEPTCKTHLYGDLWNTEAMQSYATEYGEQCARAAVEFEANEYYVAGPYTTGRYAGYYAVAKVRTGEIVNFFRLSEPATPPAVEARDERAEFDEWWDRFIDEHEDWRYADAHALRWQAWQARAMLSAAPAAPGPQGVAEPIQLNIIRKWPDGFEARLQHVWLDVVSFIPSVKLWDLQRVLAEFGFRMEVYEDSAAPAPAAPVAPEPALFYLQDNRSTVGNDMLWWKAGGSGYTTDLREAETYTQDEAKRMNRNRDTDIPWPKGYIDSMSRPAVDFQYLDAKQALVFLGDARVAADRAQRGGE